MAHEFSLIFTLTGGLAFALLLGILTHRIGLSPIVGYLLAGIVVGRHTPGFVADSEIAGQLAEVGVILLMFGVGLQFHLKELLAVRNVAVPGALIQMAAATGMGVLLTHWAGWSLPAGLVFGLSISVASTVVLTRVLTDHNELHSQTGHLAIGWLVVEDLLTVLVLVLIPALAGATGESSGGAFATIAVALGKIVLLVAFTFVFGKWLIPAFLEKVAARRSRELFTLAVLVIALGIAVGSAELFGASMALGAFLAGMIVNQSAYSHRAAVEALPMKDAFAVLFFVSVGMLFNPWELVHDWRLILLTTFVIVVGKPLVALLVVRLFRYPFRTGFSVGISLAQIGEFSFILAALGKELKILPASAVNVIVASSIISIVFNPLLYRLVNPASRLVVRSRFLSRILEGSVQSAGIPAGEEHLQLDPDHKAIVIGYGAVGRLVVRLLRENAIEPTVIELNPVTIKSLCAEGIRAIYGDAGHGDTLKEAGLAAANNLVLTTAQISPAEELIRAAREINPGVRILARTDYASTQKRLQEAGVDFVFSAEREVAIAIAEFLLERVGATPEQLETHRNWIRNDLV